MRLLRTWLGAVLAVWLAYTCQVADSTTEFLGERLNQLAVGILLPGITLPLVIGLFIAAARPHTAPGTPDALSDPWAR
ncbi:hypothetical protein [Streptomyces megasporus]|uniref:hypothetical protein n=1 Tax=Streptomyces megasporus TaxID=44060 RepID=UPI0012FF052C|nr:hypothetical protein [Streptomyces megasporus]